MFILSVNSLVCPSAPHSDCFAIDGHGSEIRQHWTHKFGHVYVVNHLKKMKISPINMCISCLTTPLFYPYVRHARCRNTWFPSSFGGSEIRPESDQTWDDRVCGIVCTVEKKRNTYSILTCLCLYYLDCRWYILFRILCALKFMIFIEL